MKFFLIFGLIFAMFMSGCSDDLESVMKESISEIQYDVYAGSFKDISATLILGDRESEYLKDGVSTENIPFAVLSFYNKEKGNLVPTKYTLLSGEKSYEGDLISNPLDGSLVVDIGEVEKSDIMVASMLVGDKYIDIVLKSLTEVLTIQSIDIVEKVAGEDYSQLKTLKNGNEFMGEIYIKLLGTLEKNSEDLCWCMSIITRDNRRFNYVLSAYTGEILSIQS